MGDYMRWAPPYYEGAERRAPGRRCSSRSTATSARSASTSRPRRGARCCCALVRESDVLVECFRPGVMDRLGVGYERLREENPGLVYCAITGYGQDGPYRDRSGHDMNYLGLVGLLGLTGERDGAPDAGGGPDRRHRRRRADGGGRDPRRAARARPLRRGPARRRLDGRRRAVVAGDGRGAHASPTASRRNAASSSSPAALVCYRPYRCADGWVTLGALEPKFWQAFCRGVGREDLIERQLDPSGSRDPARGRGDLRRPYARRVDRVRRRARLLPRAGAGARRGARLRARARARDGGGDRPARRGAPGAAARRAGQALAHARRPAARARAGAGAGHEAVLEALGYAAEEIARLVESGAVAGPAGDGVRGSFMG